MQSTIHGDLVHNPRLEFQKEASNTIHHGPQYASKHKQHDKLARKKAKYYKKLYGKYSLVHQNTLIFVFVRSQISFGESNFNWFGKES